MLASTIMILALPKTALKTWLRELFLGALAFPVGFAKLEG
jgi:hypothetical protein